MAELPNLFVIGDSISLHYGPYLERFLRGHFRYSRKVDSVVLEHSAAAARNPAWLDYPHGPFGENAGDSGMVLEYLRSGPAEVAAADVLLLNCGLHDVKIDKRTRLNQVPLEDYRQNLREIVALLAELPARAVWCTSTPVQDATHAQHDVELTFGRVQADVLRYNEVATGVMREAGASMIDLHGFTEALADTGVDENLDLASLYLDHVHFLPWVRASQAAYLAGWLIARANRQVPELPIS